MDPAALAFDKPGGVCGEYIRLAETCTDAPWHYHEAAFWTVMGVAAGRTLRTAMGPQDVYPNLYTCLVGLSSSTRKSTSVAIAHKLASAMGVPLLPSEVTPEKLFEILSERPRGILVTPETDLDAQGFVSEFLRLFEKSRQGIDSRLDHPRG